MTRPEIITAGRRSRPVRVERKGRPRSRGEVRAVGEAVAVALSMRSTPAIRGNLSTVGLLADDVCRLIRPETGRFGRELWGEGLR